MRNKKTNRIKKKKKIQDCRTAEILTFIVLRDFADLKLFPAYFVFQSQLALRAVVNIFSLPIFHLETVALFRGKTLQ